ncbi:MAG: DUF2007 domain-containing protein [Gemmataceae bacterium]
MPLDDAVAVHNSASNPEAYIVRNMLADAGIEAYVTEDISHVAMGWLGQLPELYKAQVWIERKDVERAAPILAEYEQRMVVRHRAETAQTVSNEDLEATCEECGKASTFAAALAGTIQTCPHCKAFMDVGDDELDFDSENIESFDNPEPS